jgi:hypothetical protein
MIWPFFIPFSFLEVVPPKDTFTILLMEEKIFLYLVSFVSCDEMCKDRKSSFTKLVTSSLAWKVMGVLLPILTKITLFVFLVACLHKPPYDLVSLKWEPFP